MKDIKISKEDWYKNLPEDEKQKFVEHRKNIIKSDTIPYCNYKKYFHLKNLQLFQKADLNERSDKL